MSDVSRYLPLSQRPRHDESGVSSHWDAEVAAVLGSLVAGLRAQPTEAWQVSTLHRGWTVHMSAAFLAQQLTTPILQRLTSAAFGIAEHVFSRSAAEKATAEKAAAALSTAEVLAILGGVVEATAARTRRSGIRDLEAAVVGGLDIAIPLGLDLALPASASGAVALRRALAAPVEIKAVIRGRSLRATDADWGFGRGPELVDTAVGMLLFLYERSDVPPHPAGAADGRPGHASGKADTDAGTGTGTEPGRTSGTAPDTDD
ncbi:MAG: hypothetical protein ABWX82_12850 [Leifsonia sp.]